MIRNSPLTKVVDPGLLENHRANLTASKQGGLMAALPQMEQPIDEA